MRREACEFSISRQLEGYITFNKNSSDLSSGHRPTSKSDEFLLCIPLDIEIHVLLTQVLRSLGERLLSCLHFKAYKLYL